jgi:putative glutamine amidotransferase
MGTNVSVNSTHHQGVFDPGSLSVSAHSSHDGLIEGVERTDKRFCIGVQWHPERIGHVGLYRALVDAARGS